MGLGARRDRFLGLPDPCVAAHIEGLFREYPSPRGDVMSTDPTVTAARRAFEQKAWATCHEQMAASDRVEPLGPEDLECFAMAAYLTGRHEESVELWSRAHRQFVSRGEIRSAVRCAFWIGFGLLLRGESARGGGWIARGHRLLENAGTGTCGEAGMLLLVAGIGAVEGGDAATALEHFERAREIGRRCDDADVVVVARHGCGRARIRLGDVEGGVALLDEAMAAVEAGEVSPIFAGLIYCSVIAACQEISDLRRAHEWTAALSDWCASQPDLVPYRGECLVHRAELMHLHGAWTDAMQEALRAGEQLAAPPGHPAAASAFYRQAELHRLQGALDAAEEAYREVGRWSRRPRPGLALLRLAQGRVEAAAAMVRRLCEEADTPAVRANLLPAYVEIMLTVGDIEAARAGADELETIADRVGAPMATAVAAQASGAVLLAEEDLRPALERLRAAWSTWTELEVPYEAARTRVLIARACRALGDEDGADVELDAARQAFEDMGASPDAARIRDPGRRRVAGPRQGLSPRELQVLRLVASGATNRDIAERLSISERTVERHVSNIFNKLNVSTRAAATAHAYQSGLV